MQQINPIVLQFCNTQTELPRVIMSAYQGPEVDKTHNLVTPAEVKKNYENLLRLLEVLARQSFRALDYVMNKVPTLTEIKPTQMYDTAAKPRPEEVELKQTLLFLIKDGETYDLDTINRYTPQYLFLAFSVLKTTDMQLQFPTDRVCLTKTHRMYSLAKGTN